MAQAAAVEGEWLVGRAADNRHHPWLTTRYCDSAMQLLKTEPRFLQASTVEAEAQPFINCGR